MYRGIVAGTVVATVKEPHLEGVPLLVVRKIENGVEKGLIVAADHTRQAGYGDEVYLIGSKEAARIFRPGSAAGPMPPIVGIYRHPITKSSKKGGAAVRLARVVGNVISTVKDPCYTGYKLMLVEYLDPDTRSRTAPPKSCSTVWMPGSAILSWSILTAARPTCC